VRGTNEQLEKRTRIRSHGVDPQKAAALVEEIFRWVGIGPPAVQRSVVRGEKIVQELSLAILFYLS
jgi:hypothetical protein